MHTARESNQLREGRLPVTGIELEHGHLLRANPVRVEEILVQLWKVRITPAILSPHLAFTRLTLENKEGEYSTRQRLVVLVAREDHLVVSRVPSWGRPIVAILVVRLEQSLQIGGAPATRWTPREATRHQITLVSPIAVCFILKIAVGIEYRRRVTKRMAPRVEATVVLIRAPIDPEAAGDLKHVAVHQDTRAVSKGQRDVNPVLAFAEPLPDNARGDTSVEVPTLACAAAPGAHLPLAAENLEFVKLVDDQTNLAQVVARASPAEELVHVRCGAEATACIP